MALLMDVDDVDRVFTMSKEGGTGYWGGIHHLSTVRITTGQQAQLLAVFFVLKEYSVHLYRWSLMGSASPDPVGLSLLSS